MSVWSPRASTELATGGGAQSLLPSSQARPPAVESPPPRSGPSTQAGIKWLGQRLVAHPVGRPKHFGRRQPRILYRLHPYAILLVHDKHPFTVRGKRAPTWEMQDHSKLGRMLLSGCSTRVLLAVPTWGKANSVEKNISFSSSSAYHLPRMKLKRHFFPTPNSLKRSNIATSPNYRILASSRTRKNNKITVIMPSNT